MREEFVSAIQGKWWFGWNWCANGSHIESLWENPKKYQSMSANTEWCIGHVFLPVFPLYLTFDSSINNLFDFDYRAKKLTTFWLIHPKLFIFLENLIEQSIFVAVLLHLKIHFPWVFSEELGWGCWCNRRNFKLNIL